MLKVDNNIVASVISWPDDSHRKRGINGELGVGEPSQGLCAPVGRDAASRGSMVQLVGVGHFGSMSNAHLYSQRAGLTWLFGDSNVNRSAELTCLTR